MKQEIKEQVEKIRKGEVPEGYKETKVGIIPDDWDVKRLGDLADIDPDNLSNLTNPEYSFQYISLEDVDCGTLKNTTEILFKNAPSRARRVVKKGDILLSTVRPNLKSHLLLKKEVSNWICSTGFSVVRSKENIAHGGFVFNHLFSNVIDKQIKTLIVGSNYPAINSKDVKSLLVPHPLKYNEQEKIADILSTWDKTIELKEKLIEEEKEFKKGLMQKLLTGKVRFSEFTDDWTEYQLKDICKFMKGSGLSKDKLSINGGKKCILYGELYTTYSEVIQEVKSKTNIVEGVPSQKGDVLIPASTTTAGIDLANATALEEKSVLLGGDINILRNDKSLFNSSFLAHYLTHIKKFDLTSKAQGMTIVHLYGKHLKNIQICMPKVKEQEKIVQVLSIQDDEIEILAEKLLQLKQQKRGLMQLLLTGIVRVEID